MDEMKNVSKIILLSLVPSEAATADVVLKCQELVGGPNTNKLCKILRLVPYVDQNHCKVVFA